MPIRTITTVNKAPALTNDSQFYINNTANGIKALERLKEQGRITPDNAQLIG